MNFAAIIPVANMDAANTALEEAGFGPMNFVVPLRTGAGDATHAGMHSWSNPELLAALQAIPNVVIEQGDDTVESKTLFSDACQTVGVEWTNPTNWHQNPIMVDDERTFGGKLWKSLIDYNVWAPPIGWREVVSEGYPAWVQPTSAADDYNIGDRVSFNGANYESVINGNVWSPAVYPAGWQLLP